MVALRGNEIGVVDAARALGVARQTVTRWLRRGVLDGRYDGKRWSVNLETVTTFRHKRATLTELIDTRD